ELLEPGASLHGIHHPAPVWVAGDEHLGEGDQARAIRGRLGDERADLVDGGIRVQEDGRRLHRGGLELRQVQHVPPLQTATTAWRRLPMCCTRPSITSPGHTHSCGLRPAPTPSGVPVAMMSPGSSVMPAERSAINSSTLNSMWRVFDFCFVTPLTVRLRSS